MLPDLTLHHAAALAAMLAVLALIVRVVTLLDQRQRRRAADRIAADEDAADALARTYRLFDDADDAPGKRPMTVLDWSTPAIPTTARPHADPAREHMSRIARMRAARKANPPSSTTPRRAHPVPEPDLGALRADPFKAYSRRAHVLFPADEPRNAPPKPWHIGDNPKEPQQ